MTLSYAKTGWKPLIKSYNGFQGVQLLLYAYKQQGTFHRKRQLITLSKKEFQAKFVANVIQCFAVHMLLLA